MGGRTVPDGGGPGTDREIYAKRPADPGCPQRLHGGDRAAGQGGGGQGLPEGGPAGGERRNGSGAGEGRSRRGGPGPGGCRCLPDPERPGHAALPCHGGAAGSGSLCGPGLRRSGPAGPPGWGRLQGPGALRRRLRRKGSLHGADVQHGAALQQGVWRRRSGRCRGAGHPEGGGPLCGDGSGEASTGRSPDLRRRSGGRGSGRVHRRLDGLADAPHLRWRRQLGGGEPAERPL